MSRRLVRPTGLLAEYAALETERDDTRRERDELRVKVDADWRLSLMSDDLLTAEGRALYAAVHTEWTDALMAAKERLAHQLAAIDALHQPDDAGRACQCGTTWPCKTARVLGEGK